jgi:NTP pyrophosphatase (non-canonical NTP hydrolase)
MEFQELTQRAMQIREQYAVLEDRQYGRAWTNEEFALGFVGDIGDLAKLVLAQNHVRDIPDAKAKLAHELADCLWSTMVLARLYEIDLESTFLQTIIDLEKLIASRL